MLVCMEALCYTRVKVCRVFDENRRVEALSERSTEVQTKLLVQCLCVEGVNNSLHGVTPPPKETIPLSLMLQKCCPSQPVGCLWPKSAFLWLGAERLFLSPDHCERHKKEITSSQRLRRTTSGVAHRRLVSSRTTFCFEAPLFRRTWNSSAPPCATPPGLPIVSPPALLSRMKEWLFKAKNAEGGDTPERLRASSSAFQPPRQKNAHRSPVSAGPYRPGTRSAVKRRQSECHKSRFRPGFRIVRLIYSPRLRSLTSAILFLRKLTIARML